MRVSSHAIALIQNFEGLRTKAYKPLPHEKGWTIGYAILSKFRFSELFFTFVKHID